MVTNKSRENKQVGLTLLMVISGSSAVQIQN
jgi:hypothetical protein